MKHTSKRLQALVLVLAMCVSFLQIPSFAAEDNGHSGKVIARSATFASDGSFTVTKSCDEHKNASEEVVSGKIVEKKNATGSTYIAVDKDGKQFVDEAGKVVVDAAATDARPATCAKNGTIKYYITVDEKTFYSDTFVTAKATGKHNFANNTVADDQLTDEQLEVTNDYKLLNDTATCQAAGEKTYAKICHDCGQVIETETVKRSSDRKQHAAKMKLDKDGKETNEIDFEKEYVVATTCGKNGAYYAVTKCKYCDAVMNRSPLTEEKATGLHNYEYTVTLKKDFVAGTEELNIADIKIEGKCSVCGETTSATDIEDTLSIVKDKTVKPTSACQPGSKTYTLTYTAPVLVNGKLEKTKTVQEITVAYYTAGHVAGKDEHKWSENTTTDMDSYKAPTCTEAGHLDQVKTCTVCGEKKVVHTVTTPATGKHTAAAAKKENVVAATTKKGGSYDLVVRCADCGKVLSSTHKTTAKITVKASKVTKVTNVKGKKAKVTVKKASSISGYQIQYGTKKNFKGAKAVKTKATTKTLTKLAKNKKYYVRVRTYKVVNGKTYYSSWSGSKTVTIKK